MNPSKLFRRLRATAAAALVFGGAGSAHAIIYTGSWDPLFGPTLEFLSFSGTASIYIPDACIARGPNSTSAFISNFSTCTQSPAAGSDPMRLVSAQVTLTDIRLGGPSETLDFISGFNYTMAQLASFVLGVYIEFDVGGSDDGALVGASTQYIGAKAGTIGASMTDGTAANDFYLRFGPGSLPAPPSGFGALDGGDPSAIYRTANILAIAQGANGPAGGTASNLAQVTFVVPEPGSLALVIGALGALGAGSMLRRKR